MTAHTYEMDDLAPVERNGSGVRVAGERLLTYDVTVVAADRRFGRVRQRLSAAARAFKAHALRATGLDGEDSGVVARTEALFRLRGQPFRRLHSV